MSQAPTNGRERSTHHVEQPSDMERGPDGSLRFRPRCSCGWVGEPTDQARVVTSWEAHSKIVAGDSRR